MSTDQHLTPWGEANVTPEVLHVSIPEPSRPLLPHLGHVVIFLVILGASFASIWMGMGLAVGLHLFGNLTATDLQKNTFVLIGMMFGMYGLTVLLSSIALPRLWDRSFADGIYLRLGTAARYFWGLVGLGAGTSLIVEVLSNFLPIPKSLPIDDFFKTPSSVWTVAIFGVFIAPLFEELVFRGLILPALANGWMWTVAKIQQTPIPEPDANGHPQWSLPAMIVGSLITSAGFATIHAEQLAHSWAPLAVLYCVSLILCAVRLRARSLAASAVVHAAYNFTLFATMFFATGGFHHLEKIQG
jgi:membrane protease YdiL (CAAX protease family)